MNPQIRCVTCGTLIGDIYYLFQELKKLKYNETINKKNINAYQLELDNMIDLDLNDIFNILHIERYCCRTRISTIYLN